jgi:hypothetical protein
MKLLENDGLACEINQALLFRLFDDVVHPVIFLGLPVGVRRSVDVLLATFLIDTPDHTRSLILKADIALTLLLRCLWRLI